MAGTSDSTRRLPVQEEWSLPNMTKIIVVFLLAAGIGAASSLECALDIGGVPQAVTTTATACDAAFAGVFVSAAYGRLNATGQSYVYSLGASASFDDSMTITGGVGSAYIAFQVLNTCPMAAGNCIASLSGA